MKTGLITSNTFQNHDTGPGHPEQIARVSVINENFKKLKNNSQYSFLESLPKEQYFNLVKFCDNFYTNSSSVTEIKFLNKKCLKIIGERNRDRFESKLNQNSPKQLHDLLKKI